MVNLTGNGQGENPYSVGPLRVDLSLGALENSGT